MTHAKLPASPASRDGANAATAPTRPPRWLAWIAAAALAVFAWRELALWVASHATHAGPATHEVESVFFDASRNPPWLIFLAAALLVAARHRDLVRAWGARGTALGSGVVLALGVALAGWARFVSATDLLIPALILAVLGLAWRAGGPRLVRFLAVPAALLLFAMPIPGVLINRVIFPFQLWTADYTFRLLELLRVPVVQIADTLRTATNNFIVIEGCSGLGSMEVLTLLALAFAWYTRASLLQGTLLVLGAPLIAFALNGFRVVSMVLNPESVVISVHTTQGLVAFAVGALVLALLDAVLARMLPGRHPRPAAAPHVRPSLPVDALAWLALFAVVSVAVPRYQLPAQRIPALLPSALDGYAGRDLPIDRRFLGSVGFSLYAHRAYRPESRPDAPEVRVFVGGDDRRERVRSFWSEKNRVPGTGWIVEERSSEEVPGRLRVEAIVARSSDARSLSYSAEWDVGGLGWETLRAILGLDQSPFARPRWGLVLRASTDVRPGPGAQVLAQRRLERVLTALNRHLWTLTDHQLRQLRQPAPSPGG